MYRVLFAILLAAIASILVVTAWFMIFNFHALPELAQEFVSVSEQAEYWIGLGIFSLGFFFVFALPLSLMALKD